MYKKKNMKNGGGKEGDFLESLINHRSHDFVVSPSSSLSRGFVSSDEYLSSSEENNTNSSTYQTVTTTPNSCSSYHYLNKKNKFSPFSMENNDAMLDEQLGLCENLSWMSITDENRNDCIGGVNMRQFENYSGGFRLSNSCVNFEKNDPFDGLNRGVSSYGSFGSNGRGFDVGAKPALLGLQEGCRSGNLSTGSYFNHHNYNQSNGVYSDFVCYKNGMNSTLTDEYMKEQLLNGYYYRGIQSQSPSRNSSRTYFNDGLFNSRKCGLNSSLENGVLNTVNSAQLMHSKLALNGVDNYPMYDYPVSRERTRGFNNGRVAQSNFSMKGTGELEGFSCEDSFILHGKELNYVTNKKHDRVRGQKKSFCNDIAAQNMREKRLELDIQAQSGGAYENGLNSMSFSPSALGSDYSSLADVKGYLYFFAKDQNGCRFLQNMVDQGTRQDVQIIFDEVIDHAVELMTNPFGNYLMQKLLDVCNEEQIIKIVHAVTAEPGQLVRISLNTHGTRVVQKLIETLNTRQQISAVVLSLQPGFLDLIKDLNGNHVVQRCLQCLNHEDNKFIFDAATKFCVDIATHRHGCCVLQRCIAHSTGEYREKLVAEVSANALLLAQDAFGNYVVQYILEMKIPSIMAKLNSQFEGNYVQLSTQKFSSHVVEKCLKFCEESRPKIVRELLSISNFEQLLQDPFANYVIQSALEVAKGPLHSSLSEAVSHYQLLKTSPYCKRIFSRGLLRK